jgi:hypothetical protein
MIFKLKYPLILLGALPVELINSTLGTELEAGDAILTGRAQVHIEATHEAEYPLVMETLALVISEPHYIGQSPRHNDSFELVRRVIVPGGTDIILAAINLTINEFGNYNVHSAYPLTEEKVTSRILKKHLLMPKKKGP